mmetsp:Transcript_36904/g.91863  ORF Transcript_36904/g.91863 Transcript_36904/m.91863 type:complete len:208 (+) Transcript_36904:173-796(+)
MMLSSWSRVAMLRVALRGRALGRALSTRPKVPLTVSEQALEDKKSATPGGMTTERFIALVKPKLGTYDDPRNADKQVRQLHREMTSRYKWSVRNHTPKEEEVVAADGVVIEEEEHGDFYESRRVHMDNMHISRAGDHIEITMLMTGVVEAPLTADSRQRVFTRRVFPENIYSRNQVGKVSLDDDSFLNTLQRLASTTPYRRASAPRD